MNDLDLVVRAVGDLEHEDLLVRRRHDAKAGSDLDVVAMDQVLVDAPSGNRRGDDGTPDGEIVRQFHWLLAPP